MFQTHCLKTRNIGSCGAFVKQMSRIPKFGNSGRVVNRVKPGELCKINQPKATPWLHKTTHRKFPFRTEISCGKGTQICFRTANIISRWYRLVWTLNAVLGTCWPQLSKTVWSKMRIHRSLAVTEKHGLAGPNLMPGQRLRRAKRILFCSQQKSQNVKINQRAPEWIESLELPWNKLWSDLVRSDMENQLCSTLTPLTLPIFKWWLVQTQSNGWENTERGEI